MQGVISDSVNPMSLFAQGDDWGYDALLSSMCWGSDRVDDWLFIESYKRAGDRLVEWVGAGESPEVMCLPIFYAYRHFLELALKGVIKEGADYLNQNNQTPMTHKIDTLWSKAKEVMGDIYSSEGPCCTLNLQHVRVRHP